MNAKVTEIADTVREIVFSVISGHIGDWPDDRPLEGLPDGLFDSLAALEVTINIRRRTGYQNLNLDQQDLVSISSIVAAVTSQIT